MSGAESEAHLAAPTDLISDVASGAFWVTVDMVSLQLLSFGTFAVLAHFLKAVDFGLIATSFVFVYSLKTLTIDIVPTSITRKSNASHIEYSTVFWICLGLGVAGWICLQFLSIYADRIFHSPGIGSVLRPMSLMFIVFAVAKTQEAWLLRHFRFKTLAIRSVFGALLGSVTGIVAAIHGFGVWSLVLQQLVGSGSAVVLLYATTPWKPRLEFSNECAFQVGRFCRQVSGSAILGAFNQNVDVVLVATFFGPNAVGIYSVAKRLKLALQMVASTPISAIAGPLFASSQKETRQLRETLLHIMRAVSVICAPTFIGAAAVAPSAIATIFGDRWLNVSGTFAWLEVGALCSVVCDFLYAMLIVRNKQIYLSWISLLQTTLTTLIFLAFRQGTSATIAVPFVLPYLIVLPLTAILTTREIGVRLRELVVSMLPPLVAAFFMATVILFVQHQSPNSPTARQLLFLGSLGAFTYVAAMSIIGRTIIRDVSLLIRTRLNRRRTCKPS